MSTPRYTTAKENSSSGFTLIELLVSLFISSLVLVAVAQSLTAVSRVSADEKLRTMAQLQAQGVIDTITPELRMLGNGVPFHQANFLIAQADLSDITVTQPILVAGTNSSQIQFRLNQTGDTYIVTADFDPATSSSVTLTSVDKIYLNDEIYITNATVGADDGFWGKISAINTTTSSVTFAAGSQYKSGAKFAKGSLLEVVPVITYTSGANYGGITRNDGGGAVTLLTNGDCTFEYLNSSGSALALPLVASSADPFPTSAIQNVRSIRVTVRARSATPLSTGSYYEAEATQLIGIRNLNYRY